MPTSLFESSRKGKTVDQAVYRFHSFEPLEVFTPSLRAPSEIPLLIGYNLGLNSYPFCRK